ncbi:hypothetical protein [Tsukamurella soli]
MSQTRADKAARIRKLAERMFQLGLTHHLGEPHSSARISASH